MGSHSWHLTPDTEPRGALSPWITQRLLYLLLLPWMLASLRSHNAVTTFNFLVDHTSVLKDENFTMLYSDSLYWQLYCSFCYSLCNSILSVILLKVKWNQIKSVNCHELNFKLVCKTCLKIILRSGSLRLARSTIPRTNKQNMSWCINYANYMRPRACNRQPSGDLQTQLWVGSDCLRSPIVMATR